MKIERNTVAKLKIQDLLANSKVALSQVEISHKLNGMCDKVTVYRVLDRLVEAGTVHKIVNFDGVLLFANFQKLSTPQYHNHIHFSCQNCKAVTCLNHIEPQFVLPSTYIIQKVNFMISGLCPNCSM